MTTATRRQGRYPSGSVHPSERADWRDIQADVERRLEALEDREDDPHVQEAYLWLGLALGAKGRDRGTYLNEALASVWRAENEVKA